MRSAELLTDVRCDAVHRWKRGGFVLLEAVTALALLSIGVFCMQRVIREATLARAQAQDYTVARFLLEQVVSEAEIQPWILEGETSGQFDSPNERFSWTRSVKQVPLPMPELPVTAADPSGADRRPRRVGGREVAPAGPGGKGATGDRRNLQLPVKFLGRVTATVSWKRGGQGFQETVETLFNPDKLVPLRRPDEAAAGAEGTDA